ncbi:hypothetical protein [Salinisphaera hydrothermalis]|uniref:Uncharacterized protein n=1 Tax=Salinisphaera hydrothermalis (strain C41B8) TaxID=1304275 RepID=A0A084IHR3_SALHC|nr:hypothetical protein [Salinisphaera hydrothermalis]KEZ76247.1 hypothetical protein C41B8_15962 [Salinisphaera hydrothermalis C41B8]
MKKFLAGISIAMLAASPLAFAQNGASGDGQLQSGGAAGADHSQELAYGAMAAAGAAAAIGASLAVASGGNNKNVNIGGTGGTGTGGTGTGGTGGTGAGGTGS